MKNKTEKTAGKGHGTVSGTSRKRHLAGCDKSRVRFTDAIIKYSVRII